LILVRQVINSLILAAIREAVNESRFCASADQSAWYVRHIPIIAKRKFVIS